MPGFSSYKIRLKHPKKEIIVSIWTCHHKLGVEVFFSGMPVGRNFLTPPLPVINDYSLNVARNCTELPSNYLHFEQLTLSEGVTFDMIHVSLLNPEVRTVTEII